MSVITCCSSPGLPSFTWEFCDFSVVRKPRKMLLGLFAAVGASILYFTYVSDNVPARDASSSRLRSCWSRFSQAYALVVHKPRAAATSSYFLAAVFLAHSCLMATRALTPLSGPHVETIFSSSTSQVATYISALICTTLWTFGFILMVNQRLNAERQATIMELKRRAGTNPHPPRHPADLLALQEKSATDGGGLAASRGTTSRPAPRRSSVTVSVPTA
ncbi:MAG: hypothetical protein WDO73_08215 [Ignavibacteriota bacterium]